MPPRNGVIQKPRNAKGTLRRLGRYLWQRAPLLMQRSLYKANLLMI